MGAALIGVIGNDQTAVPVFWCSRRDGFPYCAMARSPRMGVAKFWTDLFFLMAGGIFFLVMGGCAADLQTIRLDSSARQACHLLNWEIWGWWGLYGAVRAGGQDWAVSSRDRGDRPAVGPDR